MIPFLAADRDLVEPAIEYARAESIGDGYYASAHERLRRHPAGGAHRANSGVRIHVKGFGKVRVTVAGQLVTKEQWDQEPVKELFLLLLAHPDRVRRELVLEAL